MSGSASKKSERLLAGIECNGCNKFFASLLCYDQHRRSNALSGTVCSALSDENRTNLYAVSRPNMSTIGGSECGRDRLGFGCPAVYSRLRGIQYYRVLNIINLKIYIVFIMFYNVL
jgi:hypothetical protein